MYFDVAEERNSSNTSDICAKCRENEQWEPGEQDGRDYPPIQQLERVSFEMRLLKQLEEWPP